MKNITSNQKIIHMRNEFMATHLKSHFGLNKHFANIEKEVSKDYLGREIWEILQNAHQAFNSESEHNIKIELIDNVLRVYNNGNKFLIENGGIKNLMVSHITEKDEKYFINKGLGFRSLLNIASEIRIYSGDISVKYSYDYARQFFLDNGLTEHISILAAPEIIENWSMGYDTCIEITLKRDSISKIEAQIRDIKFETIVFLKSLEKLDIQINDDKKSFTRLSSEKTILIKELFGQIDQVYEYEEYQDNNFEIMIAYNENINKTDNYLYSYFKTNEVFPLQFLINANFELNQNRNNLAPNSIHNIEISKKILDMTFDFSKNYFNGFGWDRFQALTPPTLFDFGRCFNSEQNKYSFIDYYKSKLVKEKILPAITYEYISIQSNPYYYKTRLQEHLSGKDFCDLLLHTTEQNIKMVEELHGGPLKKYDYNLIKSHINSCIKTWSDRQRISCSISFAREYEKELDLETSPNFFLSIFGELVNNQNLFTSPLKEPKNYPFLKISFLSKSDKTLFEEFLDLKSEDRFRDNDIIKKLKIKEYKIEPLILSANRTIENENNPSWVVDYLKWLFENNYKETTNIYVITKKDSIKLNNYVFFRKRVRCGVKRAII